MVQHARNVTVINTIYMYRDFIMCWVKPVILCVIVLFNIINPLTAKLFNWNFHPLEVVSCWRDPQLQVSENYSDLTKWRSKNFKSCW